MRERIVVGGATGALVLPLVAFALMSSTDSLNPLWMVPEPHFWIVTVTACLAAMLGAALMLSVQSLATTRSVFLALGFVAVAIIFMSHGLGTPGVIAPRGAEYGQAVSVSAGLSFLAGAVFIACSVLPPRWFPGRVEQWGPAAAIAVVALLLGYAVVTFTNPGVWSNVPLSGNVQRAVGFFTIGLLLFAAWRYWLAWRMTELPGQYAMVAATVLLAEGQVSMLYGDLMRANWWLYHALMLAAFLSVVAGWGIEARRAGSLLVFARSLTLREALERLGPATPQALAELEEAMETRDPYTRHHMGRVARYAVGIARELKLDPLTIELVEAAGRVHDIGKIVVPDTVLMKPGQLSEREFEQIKSHAMRGEKIALLSPSLVPVAPIIRAHHERFAGNGYPDGLGGDRIPLAARIVAVADTFDAMTSSRVYRSARPPEVALAELQKVAGTQLDPDCVRAFVRWYEREGYLDEQADEGTVGQRLLAA
jgi:HD-GYP domain-containing protein (c-di-GMP phosphodiesterase class II)